MVTIQIYRHAFIREILRLLYVTILTSFRMLSEVSKQGCGSALHRPWDEVKLLDFCGKQTESPIDAGNPAKGHFV